MGRVIAPEFLGIVGGGSAAFGQYVFLTVRLGDKDQPMLIEKSRVGVFMLGLATAAGLARKERTGLDPGELNSAGADTAYALVVTQASVGRSSKADNAIIDLQIDANGTGAMNLYLAADSKALTLLRDACDAAIDSLSRPGALLSPN